MGSALPDFTLAILAGMGTLAAWRSIGFSPVTLALGLWAGVFGMRATMPLSRSIGSVEAWLTLSLGIVCLTLPALLFARRERGAVKRPIAVPLRLAVAVGTSTVLLLIGLNAFLERIVSSAGVDSLSSLTLAQVRLIMNTEARGGGLTVLLLSLAPVVACLGIAGGVFLKRWWIIVLPIPFVVLYRSPARSAMLTLVVASMSFGVYCLWVQRRSDSVHHKPTSGTNRLRRRSIMLGAGGLGASLAYFISVGAELGKNDPIEALFPTFPGPTWLVSPVLYLTGGPSALSTAMEAQVDPYPGEAPSSIYVVGRLLATWDSGMESPETIASFVHTPMPFNVYTAFGQMYFDFGLVGVIVLTIIMTAGSLWFHGRALCGRIEHAWLSSLTLAVLLSTPLTYRLLNLDVVFTGMVGFVMLRWVFPMVGDRESVEQALDQGGTQRDETEGMPRRSG